MALPNITDGQIALDPVNRIFYYLDSDGNLVNSSLNLLQESSTSIVTEENLTVNNITVLGETTVIESTVTTVKDPIMTLGGTTPPTIDDNKDRGIEFRWHDGTSAKVGFFGFDNSTGKFTFIPDATNTSEVFTGDIGELAAKIDWDNILNKPTFVNSITGTPNEINVSSSTGNIIISLPATAAVNISGTSAGWTTPREIALSGDVTGNVLIDGSNNVTINTTISANSVALGSDTTGDYVANLIAGTGITINNGTGEQSQPSIGVTPNTYDAYGAAAQAESNAAADASNKAATAYNNATIYVNNQIDLIQINDLSDVTINTSLANSYLKFNGTAWVNDQIDLTTDTTGNYVQSLVAGSGIIVSNNSGEGSTPTVSASLSLDDLTDVDLGVPGNSNLLTYDGNTNTWTAATALDLGLQLPNAVISSSIIGDNSSTSFNITHGFNTENPLVFILKKNQANNFEVVNALWEVVSNNQVRVEFETAPGVGEAKVLVAGDLVGAALTVSGLDELPDVIVSGASSGEVLFKDGQYWVSHSLHLEDLADVLGTNAATPNQFLKYDGNNWVGSTINEINAVNDLSDVVITEAFDGELLIYDGSNWVNSTLPTSEPTGFENKVDSIISLSGRTFTIEPFDAKFTVWCKGKRYIKESSETVTITDNSGLHYIYYNSSGVLSAKYNTYFDFENEAPIAYIYWDQGGNTHHFFGDERHGIVLDWQTHEYLHRTRGAVIANGFGANGYMTSGDGNSNLHAVISIADGTFFDEDLQIDISHSSSPSPNTWEQRLQANAYIPIFYHSGAVWKKDIATEYPMKQGTERTQYNLNTSGNWSTVDIDANKWGITWVVATNNLNEPIIGILGQDIYLTIGEAEAAIWEDLNLDNFPVFEFRPLHKIIYQTSSGYTNDPHAAIRGVLDLRRVMSSDQGIPTTPVSDHGSMTGLGDNDHPQYLLVEDHDTRDHSNALSTAVLSDLSDVASNAPTSGQFLKWNGTSWIPDSIPTINSLDDIGDVNLTGAASGSMIVYDGNNWVSTSNPVISGNLTVSGDLVVNGNTVTLNTETITVEDKTIQLGTSTSPSNTTADGSGIIVPDGGSDKSFVWSNASSAWSSSEDFNLATGKVIKINGTQILSATNYTGEAATVANNSISTEKIVNSSISTEKIVNSAVTQDKISDRAVGSEELSNLTLNAQTGTSYTLALSDAHKLVTLSNSSSITLTVPSDSIAFQVGDQVNILQLGTGQVSFSGAVGVTLRSEGSKVKLTAQYALATLVKIGSNEWVLVGNLTS